MSYNPTSTEAPVAKDNPMMIAWAAYKATDEYRNSHSWAVRYIPEDDESELERIRAAGANPWTRDMKVKAVEGSLWAAFTNGYQAKP